mgnify:FL=1|tara:strand:- start:937 stop:1380 length:444 start_codon:yes stop_codon:yes gene_type:complete
MNNQNQYIMRILILFFILFSIPSRSQFSEYSPLAISYSEKQPKVYQQVKKFCLQKWMASSFTPRRLDDAQAVLVIYDIHAQLTALNQIMKDPTLDMNLLKEIMSETIDSRDKNIFEKLIANKRENLLLENCMFDWSKTNQIYQSRQK